MMRNICPICLKTAHVAFFVTSLDVSCEVCGKYFCSKSVAMAAASGNLVSDEKRHVLSGAIRNLSEQGVKVEILKGEDIETILDSVSVPSDPFEKIDWLLKYLFRKASKADEYVPLNRANDYSILFAKDTKELDFYLQKALELRYIEQAGDTYRLNLRGWERLDELREYERKSDQAFVAMWFKPDHPYLHGVYENGFKPALEETGYKPIKMDWEEHNEKICDMIIAEIRKSGLLVADVTGHRENVYFEVGFAMGLGIPVIWTCCKTDIEKLPFDTRQYNHIVWSDPGSLKEQLIKRIEATLPIRPRQGP